MIIKGEQGSLMSCLVLVAISALLTTVAGQKPSLSDSLQKRVAFELPYHFVKIFGSDGPKLAARSDRPYFIGKRTNPRVLGKVAARSDRPYFVGKRTQEESEDFHRLDRNIQLGAAFKRLSQSTTDNEVTNTKRDNAHFVGRKRDNAHFVGRKRDNAHFVGRKRDNAHFVGRKRDNAHFVGRKRDNARFVGK